MAAKKSKKTQTDPDMSAPAPFYSPLDLQAHEVVKAPESAMQVQEPPVHVDTDIHTRVQMEIEGEYPRARLGVEGLLDAILRELIRARLSR